MAQDTSDSLADVSVQRFVAITAKTEKHGFAVMEYDVFSTVFRAAF